MSDEDYYEDYEPHGFPYLKDEEDEEDESIDMGCMEAEGPDRSGSRLSLQDYESDVLRRHKT